MGKGGSSLVGTARIVGGVVTPTPPGCAGRPTRSIGKGNRERGRIGTRLFLPSAQQGWECGLGSRQGSWGLSCGVPTHGPDRRSRRRAGRPGKRLSSSRSHHEPHPPSPTGICGVARVFLSTGEVVSSKKGVCGGMNGKKPSGAQQALSRPGFRAPTFLSTASGPGGKNPRLPPAGSPWNGPPT
jgi:hypothetical protein